MRPRNRLFAFVGLLIFLHLSFIAFRRHLETPWPTQSLEGHETAKVPKEQIDAPEPVEEPEEPPAKEEPRYCQYNECLKGRWIPRVPQFGNLKEFQDVFASRSSSLWHKCPIQDPVPDETRTEEEIKHLESSRLVNMMNWVWLPDRGEQIGWDPEDLVVRLLKTPSGIIFMGDSVSAGHEHAFGSYLEQGGIKFNMINAYIHGNETQGIRPHILRPNDPTTLELQKRAGVPDSRLKYPIFTIVEEHMILQPQVIREITENHGATKGFTWVLNMKRIPGWEDWLQETTTPRPGEEGTVTDDSIVFLNTGAHWSRGTLHMLPNRDTTEEEHRTLLEVYKEVVRLVIEKMSVLNRVKVLYRSTNAAHPRCWQKKQPYRDIQHALKGEANFLEQVSSSATDDNDRRVRLRWDWDRFNIHNQLWREEIPKMQREREELAKRDPTARLPPKWLWVDFWEMSLQRPDAHSDCLHWCLPAVYAEWNRHIYHLLYLESEGQANM